LLTAVASALHRVRANSCSPRYTRRVVEFKDDEVPLHPGDSWTRRLPFQLNDLGAPLGEGWIAAPGTYRIRVRYESERSAQERSAAVWRGSAPSKWIQIRLREPDSRERTRRLEQLEKCVRNDVCDSTEVGNFFRVVRDRRSRDRLLRLLERRPYDIWLLDAIVFQARPSDAARLRDLASKVVDPSIAQQFIDAAIKLEADSSRR